MPWSRDSRGEEKLTSLPSTFIVPSLCGWRPAMILIRVDLPAPLSPRTQVTSPARTVRLMPLRARMAPYVLPTSFISMSGSPEWSSGSACSDSVSVMSAHLSGGREPLDVEVDHDGEQEHDAEEGPEPVGVPAGVDDAEARHAEDERADGDADGVAVAAGEQRATHDRGDDVEELVADAVAGLEGVELVERVHADEPAEERHAHEQADLDGLDRDADGTGGVGVAADGVDPVADLGALEDERRQGDEEEPPEDGDLDGDTADLEARGEDRVEGLVAVHLVDVGRRDRAGDELRDPEVRALQHEERAQGDEEARYAGPHHQVAVEEADGEAEDEREHGADDEVDAELVAEHRVDEPRRGDDDAGGEVELAADHEHSHGDRDDADGGGLVEHGEERRGRPEGRGDDEEEDEDDDRRDDGPDLGAGEQAVRPAERDPVRRLGWCRGWSLGGLAHGPLRSGLTSEQWSGGRAAGPGCPGRPPRWVSACCSWRTGGSRRCSSSPRTTVRSGRRGRHRCRCRSSCSGRATGWPGSPA